MQRDVWRLLVEILDKKEASSRMEAAVAYLEISLPYETMNEFETAFSL